MESLFLFSSFYNKRGRIKSLPLSSFSHKNRDFEDIWKSEGLWHISVESLIRFVYIMTRNRISLKGASKWQNFVK